MDEKVSSRRNLMELGDGLAVRFCLAKVGGKAGKKTWWHRKRCTVTRKPMIRRVGWERESTTAAEQRPGLALQMVIWTKETDSGASLPAGVWFL